MVGNFWLPPAAISQHCCVTLGSVLHFSEPRLLLCEVEEEGKRVWGWAGTSSVAPLSPLVSLFKSNYVLKGRKQATPTLLNYFLVGQMASWILLVLNTTPSSNFLSPVLSNHRPGAPISTMAPHAREEWERERLGNHVSLPSKQIPAPFAAKNSSQLPHL